MIPLIITFGCLFYWLLKETNFLRVNLRQDTPILDGQCCDWQLPDSAVTEDMKCDLIYSWNCQKGLTKISFALLFSIDEGGA